MGAGGMARQRTYSLHSAAAIGTDARIRNGRGANVIGAGFFRGGFRFGDDLLGSEEAAATGEVFSASANSEEAIVADAVEAVWQDMEQKTADEFSGVEGHELGLGGVTIILPGKADFSIVGRLQSRVGDGDAVGIAGQIGENPFGSGEWAFGVYDPVPPPRFGEMAGESARVGKMREVAEELKFGGVERCAELVDEDAAKETRQWAHRQEEAGFAGFPALSIE
jgi:hypothetical protein